MTVTLSLRLEASMRLSAVLLAVSLLGVLAGGWLTGRLGFGLCVIADSAVVGLYAWYRDDGTGERQPQAHGAPTLHEVLERAGRSG